MRVANLLVAFLTPQQPNFRQAGEFPIAPSKERVWAQLQSIDFEGGGVTSLLFSNSNGLVVGTKVGKLYCVALHSWTIERIVDENRRLPIFSLAPWDEKFWMAGGGDRKIYVYDDSWKLQQVIGPHTGWVKDLQCQKGTLFSIGCNRVEQWSYGNNQWVHSKTVAIDSSAEACTSSSDLLCLTVHESVLYVGGVDGRIHAMDERGQNQTVLAHNGRVNQLAITDNSSFLVSASHDGTIKCWDSNNMVLLGSCRFGSNVRITSLLSVRKSKQMDDSVYFAAGSHHGHVYIVKLKHSSDGIDFTVMEDMLVGLNRLADLDPFVHSICQVPGGIVVGHSQGLLFFPLSGGFLKANPQ